ncbi:MAG: GntR family transcriptional regulator [Opitutaceae bacterium]|jgi:DNA-binding GntR family transcriptional regulator|nr:GntR family transcriptional regulator [Opitutaceae bacterium]
MNLSHTDFGENEPFETSAVRLYHELQHEILAGKLHPGARLVRRELCSRFGLSQSTITEALWRLESDGLVESAPMYGTRVCEISPERTRGEHVLREALECQIAREVAEVLHPCDEPRLLDLADKVDATMRADEMMKAGATYSGEGMELHRSFHTALAEVTGIDLLIREVDRQWRRHLVLFNWISSRMMPVPDGWHRTLLVEIFSRDPDRAERAMRTHVRYGRANQLQVLAEIRRDHQAAANTPGENATKPTRSDVVRSARPRLGGKPR